MRSNISVYFFANIYATHALAVRMMFGQKGIPAFLEIFDRKLAGRNPSGKTPESHQHCFYLIFLMVSLMSPIGASCAEPDWSIGAYGGKHFDTEPANFANGNTKYQNQFIAAVTASKNVWRDETLPFSLEIDGMVGYQFGLESFYEVAVAPVLRWSSFPWKETLQTDFRFGPLGVSYTTIVSPLERGVEGKGSKTLNFLLVELAFSLPEKKANEVFLRLHHRCTIYDLLNNYGANGEDFFALGYRQFF
jgi:hypothetical protein